MTSSRKVWIRVCMALAAIGALALPAAAQAAVPQTLTEQGRLFDGDGMPIDGEVSIQFALYAEETGGKELWSETLSVTLESGFFSVQLGADSAFDETVFDGTTRYLGVTVATDDEMSPRQVVSSVPYALHAGTADTAGVASAVAWGGISGFPSACAAPNFLRGFTTKGVAVCEAPLALSCTNRWGHTTSGTSSSSVCAAGEIATGGGCSTGGALRSAYPYAPCAGLCLGCPFNPADGGTGTCGTPTAFSCLASAATSITTFAVCCGLK